MNTNATTPANATAAAPDSPEIRHISASQLAQLGVSQIAYIKPVVMNGTPAYAIHAADGTPMAVAAERELAIAAIRQHDMTALLVH
ncbi:MAG: DUF1150 family protein [Acidisphaera sp.]|nr:DUF1150 family protein [Acidisphaera sp.]